MAGALRAELTLAGANALFFPVAAGNTALWANADPFGFLFGRAQRLAEEQLVQLHKRGCSAREMPAAGMLGRCSEVATFPSDFGTVGV